MRNPRASVYGLLGRLGAADEPAPPRLGGGSPTADLFFAGPVGLGIVAELLLLGMILGGGSGWVTAVLAA